MTALAPSSAHARSYHALAPRGLSLDDWSALLQGARTPLHRFDAMEWIGDSALRFLTRWALITAPLEREAKTKAVSHSAPRDHDRKRDGKRGREQTREHGAEVGELDRASLEWLSNAGMEDRLRRAVPHWNWTADTLERVVGWAWTLRDWTLLASLFREMQWIKPRIACDRVVPCLADAMNSYQVRSGASLRRDGVAGLPATVRARLLEGKTPVPVPAPVPVLGQSVKSKNVPERALHATRPVGSAWAKCGDWSLVLGHAFAQPWHLVECLTFVGKSVPAVDVRTGKPVRVRTQDNGRLAFLGDGLLNLLAAEDRARSLLDRERAVAALTAAFPTASAAVRIVADYAAPDVAPGMTVLSQQVYRLRSNKLWSRIGFTRHAARMWFQASRELDQSYPATLAAVASMVRDVQSVAGAEPSVETVRSICARTLERVSLPKAYADVMEASFGAVFVDLAGSLHMRTYAGSLLDITGNAFDHILAHVWTHVGGRDIVDDALDREAEHALSLVRGLVRRNLDPLDPEVLLRATAPRPRPPRLVSLPTEPDEKTNECEGEDDAELECDGVPIVC